MQLNTHISTNFKSCFQWINSTLVLVNLSIKTPKWNINTVHCVRKHAHQLSHTQRWLLFKELVVLDKRRSEVSCGLIWLRHFSSPFARRTVTSPNLYSTGKWYLNRRDLLNSNIILIPESLLYAFLMYRPEQANLQFSHYEWLWIFQDIPVTQISRKIIFGESRRSKTATFGYFGKFQPS